MRKTLPTPVQTPTLNPYMTSHIFRPNQSNIMLEWNTLEVLTRGGKGCLGSATDVAENPQEESCSAASMENHNHPALPDLPPPT